MPDPKELTFQWATPDRPIAALRPKDPLPSIYVVFGPPGPTGATGGEPFEFFQNTPAMTWTVNHNFGRFPAAVMVLSPGGVEVEALVTNVNANQLVVQFVIPYTGSVRCI